MFSNNVSSTLTIALLVALSLPACTFVPPAEVEEPAPVDLVMDEKLWEWFVLHSDTKLMTKDEAVAELVRIQRPNTPTEKFYYALLNQRLDNYNAWINARDTFRKLTQDGSLSARQVQYAALLQEFNQTKINCTHRLGSARKEGDELARELAKVEAEKSALQEKIQSLTELETVISDRKEN